MPKIKTHSGAKKRFTVTKSGKVKYSKMNKRHDIKGCRSTKRKRILRNAGYIDSSHEKQVKLLIPYK